MAKKRVFSGIQPSGDMHIGNYLGAILNWVRMQDERDNIFCIVDEHAITVPQDSKDLRRRILELAKIYLAAGIDPEKSAVFVQSSRPEHTELGWILNCYTQMGELRRMTQFKDKSGLKRFETEGREKVEDYVFTFLGEKLTEVKEEIDQAKDADSGTETISKELDKLESVINNLGVFTDNIFETYKKSLEEESSVGLFDYPVLMAADILLYQTDEVPVGDDQKQHVEICRDIAERFNKRYGKEVLRVPEFTTNKAATRIMSLTDPTVKMSKSDANPKSRIEMLDTPDVIRKKFASAVTDSDNEIKFDEINKPGISNLLNILSACTEVSIKDLEKKYQGVSYGEFKKAVAEAVIELLTPFQERYHAFSDEKVIEVLKDGAERVAPRAQETLRKVKEAIGLGI